MPAQPAITPAAASLDSPAAQRPVPYTLTPEALAVLATDPPAPGPVMYCGCGYDDCTACAGCGWACLRCGLAFFGRPPENGRCDDCTGTKADR
jgi:hypothetical protein